MNAEKTLRHIIVKKNDKEETHTERRELQPMVERKQLGNRNIICPRILGKKNGRFALISGSDNGRTNNMDWSYKNIQKKHGSLLAVMLFSPIWTLKL